jgi:hypothetical protein
LKTKSRWSEHVLGCFGTAPAEALFRHFGVRADVSRGPTFMIVIRNGGIASRQSRRSPRQRIQISTALQTTFNILHSKLGLDRRPGNEQQPAKSMWDTPEHSAVAVLPWAAREERLVAASLIIAVERCFCCYGPPSYSAGTGCRHGWPTTCSWWEIDVSRRAAQDERRRTAVTVSISRCQPPDVVEGGPLGPGPVEPAVRGEPMI